MNKYRPWTIEESTILQMYFEEEPWESLTLLLPDRSFVEMWNQASNLGVLRKDRVAWTAEEEAYLRAHQGEATLTAIANTLHRSPRGIRKKLETLGLAKKKQAPAAQEAERNVWGLLQAFGGSDLPVPTFDTFVAYAAALGLMWTGKLPPVSPFAKTEWKCHLGHCFSAKPWSIMQADKVACPRCLHIEARIQRKANAYEAEGFRSEATRFRPYFAVESKRGLPAKGLRSVTIPSWERDMMPPDDETDKDLQALQVLLQVARLGYRSGDVRDRALELVDQALIAARRLLITGRPDEFPAVVEKAVTLSRAEPVTPKRHKHDQLPDTAEPPSGRLASDA